MFKIEKSEMTINNIPVPIYKDNYNNKMLWVLFNDIDVKFLKLPINNFLFEDKFILLSAFMIKNMILSKKYEDCAFCDAKHVRLSTHFCDLKIKMISNPSVFSEKQQEQLYYMNYGKCQGCNKKFHNLTTHIPKCLGFINLFKSEICNRCKQKVLVFYYNPKPVLYRHNCKNI